MMRGYLKLAILNILSKKESSGYDIMKYVKNMTGVFMPSPGSLYPALKQLKEEKLVDFKVVGRRKVYHLTKQGRRYLKDLLLKKRNFYQKVIKKLHITYSDDKTFALLDEIQKNKELANTLPRFINITNKAYLILFKNKDDKKKLKLMLKKYSDFVKELEKVGNNEKKRRR